MPWVMNLRQDVPRHGCWFMLLRPVHMALAAHRRRSGYVSAAPVGTYLTTPMRPPKYAVPPRPKMQVRTFLLPAFAAALLGLSSCSSGSGPASLAQPSCDDGSGAGASGNSFCVVACNLGCGALGCAISEIAQNQPVTFEFNKPVDPQSVNFTTIQIKTDTGEEPVGQFLVSGSSVTFAPDIQEVGNISFFGFKNGATYSLLIRKGGGNTPTVRSTSGQPVERDVLCNLRVSRGIVDLDNAPPRATLVSPSRPTDVSRDVRIVLEFSEILDRAPFQGSFDQLPVRFLVWRTVVNNGVRECVIDTANEVLLRGALRLDQDATRRISVLTLVPGTRLPPETCIEIQVTARVRDVAGTSARPQIFRFTIESGALTPRVIEEPFLSQQSLDTERSAGEWSGGDVMPARIGGSGRHGDFGLPLLENLGSDVYLWNLERHELAGVRGFIIPGSQTISGADELVSNGEFHFTSMALPEGTRIKVIGASALRLFVRGRCEILGTLDLAGASVAPNFAGRPAGPVNLAGQAGGRGGAGGGAGGDGGSLEVTMGTAANPNKPLFNGKNGGAGSVDSQHGYLSLAQDRGGRASTQWPASGLNSAIVPTYIGVISQMAPTAGSGGGWLTPGGDGLNRSIPAAVRQGDLLGGGAVPAVTLSPLGRSSLVHFLLGGAGGGGGGSHTYFRAFGEPFLWCAGGGGGGGGGALLLRVGRDLVTGPASLIDVSGGSGATNTLVASLANGPATPGGGGSAGTVLMQTGSNYRVGGLMRALGGAGGSAFYQYQVVGGDRLDLLAGNGAAGYVRVEALVAPLPVNLGQVQPPATAANVGALTDRDRVVGLQSRFAGLTDVFPPVWTAYELTAEIDGATVVYSDDPARGSGRRAIPFDSPLGLVVQGTRESGSGPAPTTRPWRQFVGRFDGGVNNLNEDTATYIRFQLIFNYDRATTIRVLSLKFHYQN